MLPDAAARYWPAGKGVIEMVGVREIVGVVDGVTEIVGVMDGVTEIVGVMEVVTEIVGVLEGVMGVGAMEGVALKLAGAFT